MMPVHNSFYGGIVSGISQALAETSYATLLADLPLNYSETGVAADVRHLLPLLERRVDGLIFRPTDDQATDAHLAELRRRRIPFVTVDRHLPGATCDFVGTDDHRGAALAAAHLLGLGHRHVAFLAGPDFVSTARLRRRGFTAAIARGGGECTTLAMADFVDVAAAKRLLALRPRPTAVLCVNDFMAIALLRVAREQGVRVPEELSVIGFADVPEAAVVTPALTTLRQDPKAIGRAAARLLLQRIERPGRAECIRLMPELVVRESTAPAGRESTARCVRAAARRLSR
jgi:LacI family transcriptional regulator